MAISLRSGYPVMTTISAVNHGQLSLGSEPPQPGDLLVVLSSSAQMVDSAIWDSVIGLWTVPPAGNPVLQLGSNGSQYPGTNSADPQSLFYRVIGASESWVAGGVQTYLSSPLTGGVAVTSLSVAPLPTTMTGSQTITVGTDTVTTTGTALAGATTLSVNSYTPSQSWGSGTSISWGSANAGINFGDFLSTETSELVVFCFEGWLSGPVLDTVTVNGSTSIVTSQTLSMAQFGLPGTELVFTSMHLSGTSNLSASFPTFNGSVISNTYQMPSTGYWGAWTTGTNNGGGNSTVWHWATGRTESMLVVTFSDVAKGSGTGSISFGGGAQPGVNAAGSVSFSGSSSFSGIKAAGSISFAGTAGVITNATGSISFAGLTTSLVFYNPFFTAIPGLIVPGTSVIGGAPNTGYGMVSVPGGAITFSGTAQKQIGGTGSFQFAGAAVPKVTALGLITFSGIGTPGGAALGSIGFAGTAQPSTGGLPYIQTMRRGGEPGLVNQGLTGERAGEPALISYR